MTTQPATRATKTAPVAPSVPVSGGKTAPVLSATAKGRKTARQETTKELTAAQTKALTALVTAAKDSISGAETKTKELDAVMAGIADYKVFAARALYRLSLHPAVVATGGPTKGQPALTKMAQLIGRPATSLEVYYKGTKALVSAKLATKTGQPTARERDLVMAGFKSESARVTASQAKGKGTAGKGKGTPSTTVSVATISGQLDAVVASLTKYVASMGMTEAQAKDLFAKLDTATDLIESAVAK